jgi:hypothetical protein
MKRAKIQCKAAHLVDSTMPCDLYHTSVADSYTTVLTEVFSVQNHDLPLLVFPLSHGDTGQQSALVRREDDVCLGVDVGQISRGE